MYHVEAREVRRSVVAAASSVRVASLQNIPASSNSHGAIVVTPRRQVPLLKNADPHTAGWTTVHYAAACSAVGSLEVLLSYSTAAIDATDALGRTAVAVCCTHGLDRPLAVLLQFGANRYAGDSGSPYDDDLSPLALAVRGQHWRCVRHLLSAGQSG